VLLEERKENFVSREYKVAALSVQNKDNPILYDNNSM
jgi:hypothetical protein